MNQKIIQHLPKGLLLGLILFLLGSCSHFSKKILRDPSSSPRYVIFLVHGLGGGAKTFGDLAEVLKQDLTNIRKGFEFEVIPITYATGSNSVNALDFSETLNEKIIQHFSGTGLRDDDRISLIGHSQGGVVSSVWYHNAFSGSDQERQLAAQTDSIITVGTPFWGSKLAYLGDQASAEGLKTAELVPVLSDLVDFVPIGGALIKKIAPLLGREGRRIAFANKINSVMGLGDHELRELSPMSESIYRFRRRGIDISNKNKYKKDLSLRPLAIGGTVPPSNSKKLKALPFSGLIKRVLKKAEEKGFGDTRYESDIAVLVPNSRPDFIYGDALDIENNYQSFSDFSYSSYVGNGNPTPYKLTETIHTSAMATNMARVPQTCRPGFRKDFEKVTKIIESYKSYNFSVTDSTKENKINELVTLMESHGLHTDKLVKKHSSEEKDFVQKIRWPKACLHPTYPLILDHIAQCNVVGNCHDEVYKLARKQLIEEVDYKSYINSDLFFAMRGFALDINIVLPNTFPIKNLDLPKSKILSAKLDEFIQFKFVDRESGLIKTASVSDPQIFVARKKETFSGIGRFSDRNLNGKKQKHLRFYLTGIIKEGKNGDKEAFLKRLRNHESFPLEFEVSVPGLQPRKIQAQIRPTFSTFVDVALKK